MLDQSFSSKAFYEIFDMENRKGVNIEKRFQTNFVRSIVKTEELKAIGKQIQSETDLDRKKILYKDRKEIKKSREIILSEILETISEKTKKHKINLTIGKVHGKRTYLFEENTENFFISKKIQKNVNGTYDIKQASRYSILNELLNLLEDKFPKYVIRTDIKSFYESIPQKLLLQKINEDYLLSIKTKDYINQIFDSYNSLTGQRNKDTAKGVPRGIGISAYLAELFMRRIDNRIRELDDVVYYARYVDDIIVVFIPEKNHGNVYFIEYLKQIKSIIKEEAGDDFKINDEKTNQYNLIDGIKSITLEEHHYLDKVYKKKQSKVNPKFINFLGYKIGAKEKIYKKTENQNGSTREVADGKSLHDLCIQLSENKIKKYNEKIRLSFNHFNEKKKHDRKYALKLLCARLNYLTSNTKLRNNKDKVFVGIYYSNPFLNSMTSLELLQNRIKWFIARSGLTIEEKIKVERYCFIKGFKHKKFYLTPLSSKKYKNHNCKRSNVNNRVNSGVLQFGLSEINSIWKV
ncbi:RNA-directed DNA polymerase [Chryseobacterium indologenes]|uniref:antiviral reverse transcriptase Drt3a n=1 Tax=Chryseobacterium indologenes TaxID=253 RepID=UPI0025770927|nr:antiviral reverse transcriptase Drt3a [Chryseobacterium indologenes]MDM1556115.1 RNA-directed DNA polymerase [Chryseobacterium indologenes]